VRILQIIFLVNLYLLTSPLSVYGQASPELADVVENLNEAKGELMRLPPLKDLLKIAMQAAPENRQIKITQQQEKEREKLWRLSQIDFLTLQGAAIAGRRDIFSVNSDGTVFVPNATVVDNLSFQGTVGLRVNPINIFKGRRQVEIAKLEGKRLEIELDLIGQQVTR